ncbi:hypothetical protein [Mesorhizobium sp. L2C085B000]|uniref:Pycsar system effector family protein n=1 Tax=Mesorhizobium sp. L2C085B000 TaxID=1287117 RepID=UPI0012DEEBC7|nr:hypothetical protein [Mesorhizobium sp. L2C085B000]
MGYRAAFLVVLPLLAVAAVISLTPFMPKFLHHFHRAADGSTNLLYFGDIAKLGAGEFGEAAMKRYFPVESQSVTDDYLDDLALQVAVQARIANRNLRRSTPLADSSWLHSSAWQRRQLSGLFKPYGKPPKAWLMQSVNTGHWWSKIPEPNCEG